MLRKEKREKSEEGRGREREVNIPLKRNIY